MVAEGGEKEGSIEDGILAPLVVVVLRSIRHLVQILVLSCSMHRRLLVGRHLLLHRLKVGSSSYRTFSIR